MQTLSQSVSAFVADPANAAWARLPFFRERAASVAARVDARIAAGATVLPPPVDVLAALRLTSLDAVRVVVVGQDPYPTPGDAHGLAFSYKGSRRLPASLRAVLAEAIGRVPSAGSGDLTAWARQGVLLLNTALTVEAGLAGAHLAYGWDELARQVASSVSRDGPPAAFMLWGAKAREMAALVDRDRHLVLECGHPSPLNRHRDFAGCGHFAKANAWLAERGRPPVAWDTHFKAQGTLAL